MTHHLTQYYISVHVDPDKKNPDKDRTNNIATTVCSVNSGSAGGNEGSGDCNKAEDQGNWTVSYPLITGYHVKTRTVTWTDSKGKTHTSSKTYTDYNNCFISLQFMMTF
ncbi:hypothetical protein J2T13_003356 [Paenibacillus sp. DS2015]|uniref:hypothetical protein n=1 Tax=Paenibacillus sp. DS2015 TaxID=3373917 RepID=UPI003D22CB23